MTRFTKQYVLILTAASLLFTACKKQWSDRDSVTDQNLNVNLYQQIQANGNLSVFAGYLAQFGYDKLLASSKTYTVFAPTNAALSAVPSSVTADTAQLHLFVANHIANQAFLTANIAPSYRIRNLNGKKMTFTPNTIEDANITTANVYVSNGVIDVIDRPLYYRQSIEQFLRGQTTIGQQQLAFVKKNDSTYTDTTKATVDHIDTRTGKPVLVVGTGQVTINKYYNRILVNPASEDSLYTYIILTDAGLTAERNKVSSYFKTSSLLDTTFNLANLNVLKDVVVRGLNPLASINGSLTSVNGVPVPFDKSQVVQTYNASNGIVYVMNAVNFDVSTKITPITVQCESYNIVQSSKTINNRLRLDNNGVQFRDIFVNPASSAYYIGYKLSNLYTCQYKVYLRAVNDTAYSHIVPDATVTPNGNISERITFGQITAAGTQIVVYPYQSVTPYFYAEMQQNTASLNGTQPTQPTIGIATSGGASNLNVLKYNSIYMYLVGAANATTNKDDITGDYIRLVPILQ